VTLSAADVGHRVVVRRVLPGERGPSGGPAYADVVGELLSFDDTHLRVRRRDGETVQVARADVVAGKRVPPAPPPRRAPRRPSGGQPEGGGSQ
jgi:N-acetylglutamate synthase